MQSTNPTPNVPARTRPRGGHGRTGTGANAKRDIPCRFHGTSQGCKFGPACAYVHDDAIAARNAERSEREGNHRQQQQRRRRAKPGGGQGGAAAGAGRPPQPSQPPRPPPQPHHPHAAHSQPPPPHPRLHPQPTHQAVPVAPSPPRPLSTSSDGQRSAYSEPSYEGQVSVVSTKSTARSTEVGPIKYATENFPPELLLAAEVEAEAEAEAAAVVTEEADRGAGRCYAADLDSAERGMSPSSQDDQQAGRHDQQEDQHHQQQNYYHGHGDGRHASVSGHPSAAPSTPTTPSTAYSHYTQHSHYSQHGAQHDAQPAQHSRYSNSISSSTAEYSSTIGYGSDDSYYQTPTSSPGSSPVFSPVSCPSTSPHREYDKDYDQGYDAYENEREDDLDSSASSGGAAAAYDASDIDQAVRQAQAARAAHHDTVHGYSERDPTGGDNAGYCYYDAAAASGPDNAINGGSDQDDTDNYDVPCSRGPACAVRGCPYLHIQEEEEAAAGDNGVDGPIFQDEEEYYCRPAVGGGSADDVNIDAVFGGVHPTDGGRAESGENWDGARASGNADVAVQANIQDGDGGGNDGDIATLKTTPGRNKKTKSKSKNRQQAANESKTTHATEAAAAENDAIKASPPKKSKKKRPKKKPHKSCADVEKEDEQDDVVGGGALPTQPPPPSPASSPARRRRTGGRAGSSRPRSGAFDLTDQVETLEASASSEDEEVRLPTPTPPPSPDRSAVVERASKSISKSKSSGKSKTRSKAGSAAGENVKPQEDRVEGADVDIDTGKSKSKKKTKPSKKSGRETNEKEDEAKIRSHSVASTASLSSEGETAAHPINGNDRRNQDSTVPSNGQGGPVLAAEEGVGAAGATKKSRKSPRRTKRGGRVNKKKATANDDASEQQNVAPILDDEIEGDEAHEAPTSANDKENNPTNCSVSPKKRRKQKKKRGTANTPPRSEPESPDRIVPPQSSTSRNEEGALDRTVNTSSSSAEASTAAAATVANERNLGLAAALDALASMGFSATVIHAAAEEFTTAGAGSSDNGELSTEEVVSWAVRASEDEEAPAGVAAPTMDATDANSCATSSFQEGSENAREETKDGHDGDFDDEGYGSHVDGAKTQSLVSDATTPDLDVVSDDSPRGVEEVHTAAKTFGDVRSNDQDVGDDGAKPEIPITDHGDATSSAATKKKKKKRIRKKKNKDTSSSNATDVAEDPSTTGECQASSAAASSFYDDPLVRSLLEMSFTEAQVRAAVAAFGGTDRAELQAVVAWIDEYGSKKDDATDVAAEERQSEDDDLKGETIAAANKRGNHKHSESKPSYSEEFCTEASASANTKSKKSKKEKRSEQKKAEKHADKPIDTESNDCSHKMKVSSTENAEGKKVNFQHAEDSDRHPEPSEEGKARAKFWADERSHNHRYPMFITEWCLAEFVRKYNLVSGNTCVLDRDSLLGLLEDDGTAYERLEEECQSAYRALYGHKLIYAVRVVDAPEMGVNGRTGTLAAEDWHEKKGKYKVEIEPTKKKRQANKAEFALVFPEHLECLPKSNGGGGKKKGKGKKGAGTKNLQEYTICIESWFYGMKLEGTITTSALALINANASDLHEYLETVMMERDDAYHAASREMLERREEEVQAKLAELERLHERQQKQKEKRFKRVFGDMAARRAAAQWENDSDDDGDDNDFFNSFFKGGGAFGRGRTRGEPRIIFVRTRDGRVEMFLDDGFGGRIPFFSFGGDDSDRFGDDENSEEMLAEHAEILGVSPDASASDIKKAYRRLALVYHPDKWSGPESAEGMTKEDAEEHFKKISNAYQYMLTRAEDAED